MGDPIHGKMGTEASARLVIILCLVSTLYQLGSEFKYQSMAQVLPIEEVRALNQIANELGLNNEKLNGLCKGFSSEIICDCSFEGYTICHITEIALIGSGLTGVIPKGLANLTYLKSLNLEKNQLTGSLPASLANLTLLYLDLSNNQLTGPIPESLGNLSFANSIYRLYMTIEDRENQATIVLLRKQAEQIFGITCPQLVNKTVFPSEEAFPVGDFLRSMLLKQLGD